MRKTLSIAIALTFILTANAQFNFAFKDTTWKKIYRGTETKVNDLVHTKLNVRFDFNKSYMYGKAWITLKPHFYPTDSLALDGKGMNINSVSLLQNGVNKKVNYTYDSAILRIQLGHTFKSNETYTVYIDYTAKPDELQAKGSEAITDAKGLYFINPSGKVKNKPTQIWTQGETESSSVWFPTIDKPNQKTTEEITMTVPSKYVTLSNGKLFSQKTNSDGTRTDTWKMELPHAPYLFFMGVGEYAIVKDSYKGKEVSYYVEKDYEKVARKFFGETPEMIRYFSTILGFEYPWVKYSQIVGRDYVSGAMENTTATLHRQELQQNARELVDGNKYEEYIPHELFHQWFGDLVTAESWSNLTVNESMANYSETLWDEYRHGKDAADARNYSDMQEYFASSSQDKNLVRFFYNDKEDMFDAVSYNKGGRILNMLRNYVGDSAFFKSLNLYLNTNKFKSAEATQLRLAFEEVTGKDLNWFWNQWYFGSGHPTLDIKYTYNDADKTSSVYVRQMQAADKLFKLPIAIDVYSGRNKIRYNVLLQNKVDTFTFKVDAKPDLINVDADKILLTEKKDNKTPAEFTYQYHYAKKYMDRREAIDYYLKNQDKPETKPLLEEALNDPYYKLRERVLQNAKPEVYSEAALNKIIFIAKNDPYRTTRAAAIDALAQLNRADLKSFYISATKDSSYSVAGAALEALVTLDQQAALSLLPSLKNDAKGRLEASLKLVEVLQKGDTDFGELTNKFDSLSLYEKYEGYRNYLLYLGNVNNTANFKKGVDKIIEFRDLVAGYSIEAKKAINQQLIGIKARKQAQKFTGKNTEALDEQIAYINQKTKD